MSRNLAKPFLICVSIGLAGCTAVKLAGVAGAVGGVIRVIGNAPDLPLPPGGETPTPTPTSTLAPVIYCMQSPGEPPCFLTPTPKPNATCPPGTTLYEADGARGCLSFTPTPTPSPSATPGAVTPAPSPTLPPPVVGCLDVNAVPVEAVPVFTGRACRSGFVTIGAPRFDDPNNPSEVTGWDAGCIRNWDCADGNQVASPANRIGGSLSTGGLNGVHRCQPGEGPGPEFICDRDRDGQEAYGRNIRADKSIIYPGAEADGYVPKPWERAAICRPKECPANPTPAPTTVPPSATPGPITGTCHLPPGQGDGVDCPRTSPKYLRDVDEAITRVLAAHPEFVQPGTEIVVTGHENDFRFAVVDEVRKAGFCAFFDREEVALKKENGFSEQYHVLSSANHVRRGEGSYRATCTPAWSAIPSSQVSVTVDPPLLVLWRVGNKCSNSPESPKYKNGLCYVDSTPYFRDPKKPEDGSLDGPCMFDHAISWNSYCHQREWNDPRGGNVTVTPNNFRKDPANPFFTIVEFSPGDSFLICVRPYADAEANGVPLPVLGPAEQCRTVTP